MFKTFTENYIPDYEIDSFYNLTDDFLKTLKNNGIEAFLLDVDGTITTQKMQNNFS